MKLRQKIFEMNQGRNADDLSDTNQQPLSRSRSTPNYDAGNFGSDPNAAPLRPNPLNASNRSLSPFASQAKLSLLKEAVGTLADSVEQELLQITHVLLPNLEQRMQALFDDQAETLAENISKFQRQIELSQETDMLRYQLWLKEQDDRIQKE